MARPRNADPGATRARVLAAARAIATRDGVAALSARSVGKLAGVAPITAAKAFGDMTGLHRELVKAAFGPLIDACAILDSKPGTYPVDIVLTPLRSTPDLAPLVTQVASCAGLRHGVSRDVALQFDASRLVVREFLGTQIYKATADPKEAADRLLALYFAAAFHLARDPDTTDAQVRRLVGTI